MCNGFLHNIRPRRESLSKRLRRVARAVRERDGHRCVYCGASRESSGTHLHFDHIVPRSSGGTDAAHNLVLACLPCNSARQGLSLVAWQHKAEARGVCFNAQDIVRHAAGV